MRLIQFQFFFALAFVLAMHSVRLQAWQANNGNGTFTNPLFYDEFSDPDMIRVGDDFYLTGTTMHTMPGLKTADPLNLGGTAWWQAKADEIYALNHCVKSSPSHRTPSSAA